MGRKFHLQSVIILTFGMVFGIFITILYQRGLQSDEWRNVYAGFMFTVTGQTINRKLPKHSKIEGLLIKNNLDTFYQEDLIAKKMSQDVTLLCWVLTQSTALHSKGNAIINTWGKRCNILIFISSTEDKEFPAVGLQAPEGRNNLWLKTKAAWLYIYKHYFDKAKWFLKVDDDTFVIPENIRYFLTPFDTKENHYFGRHFKNFKGYNSGGSGYIFSQASLQSFESIVKDASRHLDDGIMEDVQVGKCLAELGIHPGETRDDLAEEIFHPYSPIHHLIPGIIKNNDWLHEYSKWEVKSGPECCSRYSVAFHYIDHNDMYMLDYFIYKFDVFGLSHFGPARGK